MKVMSLLMYRIHHNYTSCSEKDKLHTTILLNVDIAKGYNVKKKEGNNNG